MISLEQVKLLESKVDKAIDYVKKVTEENSRLKGKLDSYQKRIDELEILIRQFKEEQSRIEDGILSALDRLNQFEDALESTLSAESKLSDNTEMTEKIAPKKDGRSSPPKPVKEPPIETAAQVEENDKSGEELDIF